MCDSEDKDLETLVEAIGETLVYTAREPILLVRMEEHFSPKPAKLATSPDEEKNLRHALGRLSERLGGPPRIVISGPGQELPTYDTYASAAIDEILHSFHRCRRSICRAPYAACAALA
jgi:hypothetical protein